MRSPGSHIKYPFWILLGLLLWVYLASAGFTNYYRYAAGEFQPNSSISWGQPLADMRLGLQFAEPELKSGEHIVVQVVAENVSQEGAAGVYWPAPNADYVKVSTAKDGFLPRKDLPSGNSFRAQLARVVQGNGSSFLIFTPGGMSVCAYDLSHLFEFKPGESYLVYIEMPVSSEVRNIGGRARTGNLIIKLPADWQPPADTKAASPPPAVKTQSVGNPPSSGIARIITIPQSTSVAESKPPLLFQPPDKTVANPALLALEQPHHTSNAPDYHPFPLFALACLAAIIFVLSRAALRKKQS